MSKTIQVAIFGAKGVGKTSYIDGWKEKYPEITARCQFFEYDTYVSGIDPSIKYDWIILLYDRTNIHETLTYLQNLGITCKNYDECYLVMNKCDLGGEPIDDRHRFKYGNSIIPSLGQYYHSCRDGKRYTVTSDGKSVVWEKLPKCKTTYDCSHMQLPEAIEKLRKMCEIESPYMDIIDRTTDVISHEMIKLINEITALKTKNANLENDLKAMTEKYEALKKNIKECL